MPINYKLPPDPQHAVLPRIYPWDTYNKTLVLQWLYAQANKTGFRGTLEDFKQRYGTYITAADPQDIYDLIENYTGSYRVIPLEGIDQILHTKNKVLNNDIVIEQIPEELINRKKTYTGSYSITPRADIFLTLKTADRIVEENIIVEQIPYRTEPNEAGGYTAIIA